jgi:hypothetical protein
MAARARHPEREGQILDVSMREVVGDPITCVEKIYDYFALDLSTEARTRMERYLAEHPKDEFGVHRYSLEAFGLDEDRVRSAFKGYLERFGIDPEPYATR